MNSGDQGGHGTVCRISCDAVERDRLLRCTAGSEDCCVVRSVSDDDRMLSVVHSIGREQLTVRGEI